MNTSLEHSILLSAMKFHRNSGELHFEKSTLDKIDWDELTTLSIFHGIVPQVLSLLNEFQLPANGIKAKEILNNYRKSGMVSQLAYFREFIRLHEIFQKQGISIIPVKGFWFSWLLYGDLTARTTNDLDVFIDPTGLPGIKEIMHGLGYIPEPPLERLSETYILKNLCEYNFDYWNGDQRVFHVEFHWRIAMAVHQFDIVWNDLKDRIQPQEINGIPFNTYDVSANFLLTILHHGGSDQWTSFKFLMDLDRFIRCEKIDWQWILQKLDVIGGRKLLLVGVYLAQELLETPVPELLKTDLEKDVVIRLANDRKRVLFKSSKWWRRSRHQGMSFLYRLGTRTGFSVKSKIAWFYFRHSLLPGLFPKVVKEWVMNIKRPQKATMA